MTQIPGCHAGHTRPGSIEGVPEPRPGVREAGGGIRVKGNTNPGFIPPRPPARPPARPRPLLARSLALLLFATDSGEEEKEEKKKKNPPRYPTLPCSRCGPLPLRSALHSPDPSHALEYHRCVRIAPRCAFYRGFIGSFSRFRLRNLRVCGVTFPPGSCGNRLPRPVAFLGERLAVRLVLCAGRWPGSEAEEGVVVEGDFGDCVLVWLFVIVCVCFCVCVSGGGVEGRGFVGSRWWWWCCGSWLAAESAAGVVDVHSGRPVGWYMHPPVAVHARGPIA